jgi:hypothetical protein
MALGICLGGFFVARTSRKHLIPFESALGALLLPAVLCLALPLVFPGGIYLGAAVGLSGLIYIVVVSLFRRRLHVLLAFMGLLMMALIAPIGYLLHTALGFYASHVAIPLLLLPVLTLGALDGFGRS